ncbi:uncharacterized protein LOC143628536 [Bidens hawaiensis]|uniref:uncharacterized protein LOC143628536 n=1 Tax=Bidens hawaiensis TaxID=980011 RepID=UPI00404A5CD7
MALVKRNIQVEDDRCLLCDVGFESADHITTGCLVASVVWDHISQWCKVPPIFGFTVRDLLDLYKSMELGDVEKEVFHGIVIVACWRIWMARNEKFFKGKEVKIEELIGDIKSSGYFWYKFR